MLTIKCVTNKRGSHTNLSKSGMRCDIFDNIDSETTIKNHKDAYIRYLDNIVDQIKKMKWGEKICIMSYPYDQIHHKKYCTISKLIRFSTYIFGGYGSKNILRYFISKTKDDEDYGYTKIVQILSNNSYRNFLPIKSWETFWKSYKDEPIKDRHLFELIRTDQPCKPYLDIEWIVNDNENAKNNDYTKFIDVLIYDIKYVFKERYSIKLTNDSILISSSHSEKKASFHVIIDHIIDGKTIVYNTNRKRYPNSAWDMWVALVDINKRYKKILDQSVYTTDREFRAIFSNKTSDFRPFVPYGMNVDENSELSMDDKTCLRYMVTYISTPEHFYINTPIIPTHYLVVNKKYYFDDNMFVPHVYTDKKINHILGLIRSIHRTAEYTGRSSCGEGWRFSYLDKNELCYTGNRHDSNGFYVFEDPIKGIYMKCMSQNCKGIHILEKPKKKRSSSKKIF